METGEAVQIKQIFQGAAHWIYAKTHSVFGDGGAVVVIDHSQNPEHGQTKIVTKEEIRTKADLQAELDAIQGHDEIAREERRALQVQVDRLGTEKERN